MGFQTKYPKENENYVHEFKDNIDKYWDEFKVDSNKQLNEF